MGATRCHARVSNFLPTRRVATVRAASFSCFLPPSNGELSRLRKAKVRGRAPNDARASIPNESRAQRRGRALRPRCATYRVSRDVPLCGVAELRFALNIHPAREGLARCLARLSLMFHVILDAVLLFKEPRGLFPACPLQKERRANVNRAAASTL